LLNEPLAVRSLAVAILTPSDQKTTCNRRIDAAPWPQNAMSGPQNSPIVMTACLDEPISRHQTSSRAQLNQSATKADCSW